jgi:pimeloyl-ACP methyl ester carboxylesterase
MEIGARSRNGNPADRLGQVWGSRSPGPLAPQGQPSRGRPILLLHGFASHPLVLAPLERFLRETLRREVIRLRISPGWEDLRESARQVQEVVETLAAVPDFEYADVVGHSMGGLVATYLLKQLDRGRRVRSVVTLGTPHRGAPVAWLGALLLGGLSPAVRQMVPGSDLVEELLEQTMPEGCRLVSIAGGGDRVVPERRSRLAPLLGQLNLRVPRATHWRLLFEVPVLRMVVAALEQHGPGMPRTLAAA